MTTLNKKLHRLPQPQTIGDFSIVGAILQNQGQFFDEIRERVGLFGKIVTLFVAATTFLTLYGAVLGSGHPFQAISAAIKLPLVFLGSLIACIPTLYIFDVLLGSQRSLGQTVAILLTAITTTAVLLFSFAPITIVFRLTANGYQFFSLLNVACLILAITVGVISLERGLRRTTTAQKHHLFSEILYVFWILIFILVGSQVAWGLRPFFHYPGTEFTLLVGDSNLFAQFGVAIGEFLGFWVVR